MARPGSKKQAPEAKVEEAGSSRVALLLYSQFPSFYRVVSRGKIPTAGPGRAKRIAKPRLPQVNLLPPALAFEAALRANRRGFLIAASGLTALLSLIYFGQSASIDLANQTLASAQSQVQVAQDRAREYQPIGDYFESLQTRLNLANSSTGDQIDYERVILSAAATLPSGAQMLAAEAKVPTLSTPASTGAPVTLDISACTGQEGGQGTQGIAVVGCFTMSGVAPDRVALTQIQAKLKASPIFVSPIVREQGQGGSNGGTVVTEGLSFSATAGLSSQALIVAGQAPGNEG